MSSAQPSPEALARLFDTNVATASIGLGNAELSPLLPGESEGLERARPPRVEEFRAGRHAARAALAALGLDRVAIPRNADRSPRWPTDVVGSITHVRRDGVGWAAAAVARRPTVLGLGLDAESHAELSEALWRRVLTAGELRRLENLPTGTRGTTAKLVFSAKEAVYKCQYPVTGTFLEFSDVEIELGDGEFTAQVLHPAARRSLPDELHGRYAWSAGVVITAVTLLPT